MTLRGAAHIVVAMQNVIIEQAGDYSRETVQEAVGRLLAPLGGMGRFVSRGERVLIKPNLLSGKPPQAAVTTHPEIVRAVVQLVLEAGGIPLLGDSPGVGLFATVAEKSGIAAVCRETGAELVEFSEPREVTGTGIFRRLELARAYLEADRLINLPKLKTHEMMTLTCAVKNLFGAVVGAGKAAWHLKAGANREMFARMLVEISRVRVPDLTIVDGIVAMEGNGPGSGDPRQLGVLVAGAEPVAVDVVAARIAGIPPQLLYTERAAREMGIAGSDMEGIRLAGVPLEQVQVTDFRLPHISDVQFGLPRFLKNRLRHHFTSKPYPTDRCRVCGICAEACPPGAIAVRGTKLLFDYRKCIHCFCCRELCPYAALEVREGLLLRFTKKMSLMNFNRSAR